MAPHSKRSSASDLVCEANTKHNVWIRRCAAGSAPAVSPIVHARSAQVGIGERESRRGWGQQLVVRGQLHSPMVKLVMRVAHVAPIRARCFNSKRTSFHVALELEHVESVDLRSAIRKADAVLPAFARAGQRGDTLKRVARRGRCRLLFRVGVQHIGTGAQDGLVAKESAILWGCARCPCGVRATQGSGVNVSRRIRRATERRVCIASAREGGSRVASCCSTRARPPTVSSVSLAAREPDAARG